MLSAAQIREKLFNGYSAQLTAMNSIFHNFPAVEDTFLCPFCLRTFGRDCLGQPLRLSLEHCIPEAVGGTPKTLTLTCTDCNTDMGSRVDSHLKGRLAGEDFWAGRSGEPNRIWLDINGNQVRANLQFSRGDKPSFSIVLDPRNSHPRDFEAVAAALSAEAEDPKGLGIRFGGSLRYNARKASVALLRIGYLMMFRQFGYPYVLHRNLDRVRRQIQSPDEAILPPPYCVHFEQMSDHVNCCAVLTSPEEMRAFLVIVRLRTDNRACLKGILMPGFGEPGDLVYERAHEAHSAGLPFSGRCTVLNYDPAYVADPSAVTLAYAAWSKFAC